MTRSQSGSLIGKLSPHVSEKEKDVKILDLSKKTSVEKRFKRKSQIMTTT